ncbi:hypothetical protein D9V34_07620 [Mycetocola lacteus]|uniref:ATP-grasp domain-containing protein n=1 Tax=Mycetocola lacteus TaxID=76637 RepID=A0A3L7ARR3_9MICO|nr:hypothetical protein [Mycetocola lacteus]RLP83097.1 hypothetical protein D9V34_07620 [Mycetocola lacteus]
MTIVALVDPLSSGQMYPPLLAEHGIDVLVITTPRGVAATHQKNASSRGCAHQGGLILPSMERADITSLVHSLFRLGVRHIIAGSEAGVPVALLLQTAVADTRAPIPSQTSSVLFDKAALAHRLSDRGVPALHSRELHSKAEGLAFVSTVDFAQDSLVLKPSIGAGSIGVARVTSIAQAGEHLSTLFDAEDAFGTPVTCVLAQEYFAGTEYVVDTVSFDGVHSIANVCAYQKVLSADGLFVYSRLDWLEQSAPPARLVIDHARLVLDALGRENGCSHLEIMVRAGQPRLIDFGARAHGAMHPAKTFELTGSSQIHREVSRIANGTVPPDGYALARCGRIVFFHRLRDGTVGETVDSEKFLTIPSVFSIDLGLSPGSFVARTTDLNSSLRLGLCFLTAENEAELDRDEMRVRRVFDSFFAQD